MCPREKRIEAWRRLSEIIPADLLEDIATEISLEDAIPTAEQLLAG